jgi:hypothetical protein
MIAEIFIEGKKLDVSDDISSLLTFALDDIKDFSSRSTQWSKTIVLPGTARNNVIFGGIFELGLTNDYDPSLPNIGYNFNSSKAADCVVFQDNFQTLKGTMRMLQINKDRGSIEYEVALNGYLTALSVALTAGLLTDLDFSEYDQAYISSNISSSWFNAPGSGVTFPLMDYGTYSTVANVPNPKHDWQFGTFRPALYVKEYIDKMFAAAGFRYDAPLFDTARFKGMVVPHNQKDVQAPKTGQLFAGHSTGEQLIIQDSSGLTSNDVIIGSFIGGLFSTTDNKIFTFNGASAISGKLTVILVGHFNYFANVFSSTKVTVQKGGDDSFTGWLNLEDHSVGDHTYIRSVVLDMTLNPGDTINVHYEFTRIGFTNSSVVYVESAQLAFATPATVMAPVEYGETIRINYCLPQNIRQVDFLLSIVKLFNLYVYEDQFDENLIHIRPFPKFFEQGADSVVDWSSKLDRLNSVIKIKPMSEVNTKLYVFSYAKDSDYYNDLYQKRYNQGYGSFTFDTEFEFSSNTTKVDIIFASTPLVGYQGEEKVYSTIFKLNGTTEDRVDSIIRLLQTKAITGVASWQMMNGATILGTYDHYGYAGHYDDPDNPSDDLNFGGLKEVFFQLTTAASLDYTQFNLFWSQYMAEITDKDSKMLIGMFHLTAADIFNLRFSQFRVIDGVLFRLNKITDYNTSKPDVCEVELLRVINTNYSYPLGNTAEDDNALLWNDTGAIMANDDDEIVWQ